MSANADQRLILETLMAIAHALADVPEERNMIVAHWRTLLAGRAGAIGNRLRELDSHVPPRSEAAVIATQDAPTTTKIREWAEKQARWRRRAVELSGAPMPSGSIISPDNFRPCAQCDTPAICKLRDSCGRGL